MVQQHGQRPGAEFLAALIDSIRAPQIPKRANVLAGLVSGCLALGAFAADDGYRIETVIKGIDVPWGMVWLPSGDMLVTERSGTLYRIPAGSAKPVEVENVPEVHRNGQGGLLDVELDPAYPENGWIYLTYSSREGEGGGSNTALMRAKLVADRLVETHVIYKAEPNTRRGQHYGSRIEFDDDGYLYFSVGDRGARDDNPQDLGRDGGKIYRLHPDGRVPDDNPFAGREGVRAAIYSWGHRNPQGLAKHPTTGRIWAHEHGPRGGDELNVIKAGRNYGWPILSYGINYSGTKFAEGTEREGYESPAWHWVPSIAPSGMTFVTSERYPQWRGDVVVGSLAFDYLVLCRLDGETVTGQEILFDGIGRVRNVREGPDGLIYVALERKGIVRIVPR